MQALLLIALKSLLVAGATLLILRAMRGRSAAERSWVAHLGILALIVLPVAPLAMPVLAIEAPAAISGSSQAEVATAKPAQPAAHRATAPIVTPAPAASSAASERPVLSAMNLALALYWLPAAILLGITLLAMGRLLALRARANVLVDDKWLTALARAQRRMGFKHGTALLTSDDLPSPISWGLMRPVILLNGRAVEAPEEAEAIIAHELAHVVRLDWVKLLLARFATALFWFNPLVWMLAREAHQLREEAADDTVLAADIEDTEYAQLLVGVARHECRGLLIGAHGVAPSRGSLARRIARVLDHDSPRGPVRRSFALGMVAGAAALAAPLAALTLIPPTAPNNPVLTKTALVSGATPTVAAKPANASRELADAIGDSVSSSVQTAMASLRGMPVAPVVNVPDVPMPAVVVTVPPAPPAPPAPVHAFAGVGLAGLADLHRAIAMKATGVTPEYAGAIRAAAPGLAIEDDDLVGMRAVGVTPDYVAELAKAGYRPTDPDDLIEARALGIDGRYVRELADAGYRNLPLDTLQELRAVGVDGDYIRRLRSAGMIGVSTDKLVEMRVVGMPHRAIPRPPRPVRPPTPPHDRDDEPDDDPDE